MAGIYLHIPFCKQACHYCNFHFSTSFRKKAELIAALLQELDLQRDYLDGATLDTIYFGGGTPSLLSEAELDAIFEKILQLHPLSGNAEVTLEANPDDLTPEKFRYLSSTPVNRLSIGIQSFDDRDLQFMNRVHDARMSRQAIEQALAAGFSNLTLDLIYGLPGSTAESWQQNLDLVFNYDIPHLSCYCLTVEEKTALAHFVKTGKTSLPTDDLAARQYEMLMHEAANRSYDHYEISNFARPGWHSRHNTAYWTGDRYLGIGPSAHSFDGVVRQWNVAHNIRYLQAISAGVLPCEREVLTPDQRYNEYVMTSLRTMWGCDLEVIRRMGDEFASHFESNIQPWLSAGDMRQAGATFFLTLSGKLLANRIAVSLFWG